jgi:hypothetical protein
MTIRKEILEAALNQVVQEADARENSGDGEIVAGLRRAVEKVTLEVELATGETLNVVSDTSKNTGK